LIHIAQKCRLPVKLPSVERPLSSSLPRTIPGTRAYLHSSESAEKCPPLSHGQSLNLLIQRRERESSIDSEVEQCPPLSCLSSSLIKLLSSSSSSSSSSRAVPSTFVPRHSFRPLDARDRARDSGLLVHTVALETDCDLQLSNIPLQKTDCVRYCRLSHSRVESKRHELEGHLRVTATPHVWSIPPPPPPNSRLSKHDELEGQLTVTAAPHVCVREYYYHLVPYSDY